jgi:hypothetical protein
MFYTGQKVVYIGRDYSGHPAVIALGLTVPVPRAIYTIRCYAPRVEGPGYLLHEIRNPEHHCPLNGKIEIAINAEDLRPLVEKKTDIAVFKALLLSSRREVEA